ncbi:MAG: hypothetical protein ACT4RN_14085 [Pseudonocardia sp.]
MSYPTTSTPFQTWPRTELAAMAQALTSGPVHDGAAHHRDVADAVDAARARLAVAARRLGEAQRGAAAGALAAHLDRLDANGMSGQSQAIEAMLALVDQGEAVSTARNTIAEAAEIPDPHDPRAVPGFNNRVAGVREAAQAYEIVTNTQYVAAFQPYEPPPSLAVDAGLATPPAGAGVGTAPAGGVAVAPGATPSPVGPGGAAGAPPIGGAGGAPVGETGPGTAVAPGTAVPRRPGVVAPPAGSVPGGPPPVPPRPSGGRPVPPAGPPAGRVDPQAPTTGWRPGQPWTSGGRPLPGGASGGATPGRGPGGGSLPDRGGRVPGLDGGGPGGGRTPAVDGGGPATRGVQPPAGAPTATAGARPAGGFGGFPMAGAGAGGQGDQEHQRPPWLLQDDPDAIWFAGLPEYCEPVIGASERA